MRQQSDRESQFLDTIRHAQLRAQGAAAKRRDDTIAVVREMLLPLVYQECRKFCIDPAKLDATFESEADLVTEG